MNARKFMCTRGMVFDFVVIVVFFVVISTGILVPIYADEVAFRIMRSTFFTEHGRLLTLMPQCGSDLGFPIVWSWFPAAIGFSLIFSDLSPFGIRVAGLVTAIIWLASLTIVARILIPNKRHQLRWLSAMLATLGVGVLPLTLVLARSEQWLLLLLTVFILFPFVSQKINEVRSRFGLVSLLVMFCVLVSFTLYAHPKALFFVPLICVSAYCSFYAKSRFIFLMAGLFLFWTAFQTIDTTRLIVACPDAPVFAAYMASQTTKLSSFLQTPLATLWELCVNLAVAPILIGKHLLFQSGYQSAWLPPLPKADVGMLVRLVNFGIFSEIGLVIWGGLLLPPVALGMSIKRRNFGPVFMLLAALWVGVAAHLAIYKVWNFYGGALVLGLSVLLIVISAVLAQWTDLKCLVCEKIYIGFCLVFLVSACVLAVRVLPELFRVIGSEPIGQKNQPLSVPAFGFSEQREKIRKFAGECSLHADGAHRLVVDDLTYFAFDNLREPLHVVYFYEGAFGADVKGVATIRMLERLNVHGIVAQCTFMPPLLMKQARKDGNLCCVKYPLENVIYENGL